MRGAVLDRRIQLGEEGGEVSSAELRTQFLRTCRENIHIVLAMSPIGDSLRTRLRQYPSLINHCTIDWWDAWPPDALRQVASAILHELPDMSVELLEGVSEACVTIHETVEQLSTRFYSELRRTTYVTPALYLEMLFQVRRAKRNAQLTCSRWNVGDTLATRVPFPAPPDGPPRRAQVERLYNQKQKELLDGKRRYDAGLDKLLMTAEAVADMQSELEELKPQLIVKTAQAEDMMVTITNDRRQSDETMKLVAVEEKECMVRAEEAQQLRDSCEANLADAMPALTSALKALKSLSKKDIVEVKSMKHPPAGVKLTMEMVRPKEPNAPGGVA